VLALSLCNLQYGVNIFVYALSPSFLGVNGFQHFIPWAFKSMNYRYPCFFESFHYSTSLLWKTSISTYSCLPREIQRGFSLLQKKVKSKKSSQSSFCIKPLQRQQTLSSEHGPTKLLPQELQSASQHQAMLVLNHVCEHLCFISIDFVHSLAECILKYKKSLKRCYFLSLVMLKNFST